MVNIANGYHVSEIHRDDMISSCNLNLLMLNVMQEKYFGNKVA